MGKKRAQQSYTLVLTDGINVVETVERKGFTFRDAANKEYTSRFPGYNKATLSVSDKGKQLYIVGEEFLNANTAG